MLGAMRLRLLRHATLLLDLAGRRVLVDPMLADAGTAPAVPNTPDPRPNPLVPLPQDPAELVVGLDLVLVSHLHGDHLDPAAIELLVAGAPVPVLCQPEDAETLRGHGLADVRPVDDELDLGWLRVRRTEARHGTGEVAEAMAPVSGWLLRAEGEPSLYLAGDTVLYEAVEAVLEGERPEVTVVHGGGAQFLEGGPITMDADEVTRVGQLVGADDRVVAVHFEAINHCVVSRAEQREAIGRQGVTNVVLVPEDGQLLEL
jgi:L-ascorbate metabolism protein UlaG (beta-lactamase superfamily)